MQDAPLHKKVFRAIRTSVSRAKRATKFGLSRLLYEAIGGSTIGFSTTGVDVTIPKSLQVSSYFRAINLLSDAVGKTAFAVKMGADEVPDHPAHALVKYWARHHQLSADIFRRTLMKHALLYGNGYARIVRQLGEPIRLVVLNPSYVTPVLKNGVLRYQITDPDRDDEGRRRRYTVSASDIIHIKGFTINGWVGIDPIQYWASEVLGIAISTQSYAASYYATGGQPTAYVHSNDTMSDEQWNNFENRVAPTLNSDLQNPHKMPVLENMDIKSTGLTAEQTQLIEARKHSMLEVVNMMGVPPHKVGLTQSSAYKSLEEENKAFREDALEPWLTQFEMEFRKLLTEEQQARETHRIEANRFDLSRTDVKSRFEALSKATGGAAFMTPNDARKLNGQESHPDGDTLHKPPTNEKKDGEADDGDQQDGDSSDSSRSDSQQVESTLHQVRALTHIYSRVTKRLATEAIKRSKKSEDWPDYLDCLTERHAEAIRGAFEPIIPLCGGRSEQAREITESLITEFRTQMAAIYDTATRSEFPAAVSRSADEFQRGAFELAHSTLISLNA